MSIDAPMHLLDDLRRCSSQALNGTFARPCINQSDGSSAEASLADPSPYAPIDRAEFASTHERRSLEIRCANTSAIDRDYRVE